MEPWFEWSWLVGMKPIHRNGWVLVVVFWVIEAPLMLATLGAFGLAPVSQTVAGFLFLFFGFGMWGLALSRLKDPDD